MNKISKTKKLFPFITALLIAVPKLVFADGVADIIDAAYGIINGILIPLAFSLCLLYFFWGVAKYIKTGAQSEEAAKEGKNIMVWGIVGLFVAVSIWGIIAFIKSELGIPDKSSITNSIPF